MAFPERFDSLPDYAFPRLRKLLDSHQAGAEPIAMTIGEPRHPMPDFVAPILAANIQGFNSYPPNDGTPELLTAISAWIKRRYGADVATDRLMALNGTREGLFNAALAEALRPALMRLSRRLRQESQRAGVSALEALLLAEIKRQSGIGVRVPDQGFVMGDLDAAQPDRLARAPAMRIKALADTGDPGCSGKLFGHGEVLRIGQFQKAGISLHESDLAAGGLDHLGVICRFKWAGPGGIGRFQPVTRKGLRGLGAPEAVPGHGLRDLAVAPLQGVGDGQGGDGAVAVRQSGEEDLLAQAGLREEEDVFASVWASFKNRWAWLAINLVTAFVASRVIGVPVSKVKVEFQAGMSWV